MTAVFLAFLRLGCHAFGGPAAHIGYFREEFVYRRKWLDDRALAQCVALTQILPGPSSSQTGMLIGALHAGPGGALAAWLGFTLPSAAAMAALAIFAPHLPAGPVHALLVAAVAVVASAVATMRVALAPDARRLAIAFGGAVLALVLPHAYAAPATILAGALAGAFLLDATAAPPSGGLGVRVSHRTGIVAGIGFLAVLGGLWFAAASTHEPALVLADTLFRTGSLVFGGGHVVLPVLQGQLVARNIVGNATLLSGYAAAQAMPGPLFTIASYAGAASFGGALGWYGSLLGTVAIFAPSFFLLAAVLPFYARLAANAEVRAVLAGTNAAVVGLLGAALVEPIGTTAIGSWFDAAGALAGFVALTVFRVPAWALVLVFAAAGFFV